MAKKTTPSELDNFLGEAPLPDAAPAERPPTPTVHVETEAEALLRKKLAQNEEQKAAIEAFRETLAQFKEPEMDAEVVIKARDAAADSVKVAAQLLKDAQAHYAKQQRTLDELEIRRLELDKMTETERNQQYLEAQKKERFDLAMEAKSRYEILRQAGLLNAEELERLSPKVTPLDRAIAEENLRKRAQTRDPAYRSRGRGM